VVTPVVLAVTERPKRPKGPKNPKIEIAYWFSFGSFGRFVASVIVRTTAARPDGVRTDEELLSRVGGAS
jgi:hypothetical protein